MPPLIIHLHIPKTGGTTLSQLIRLKLMAWPPAHWVHRSDVLGFDRVERELRVAHVQALTDERKRRTRFFQAHAGFGMHEHFPGSAKYVTMLREPVQRVLSHYYGWRAKTAMQVPELEAYLTKPRKTPFDNLQVRYLAGESGRVVDVPHGQCTTDMLELAKRRVDEEFLLVGLVERFEASMLLLKHRLGWRTCFYCRSNITRERPQPSEIDTDTIAMIEDINTLDMALYAHAKQRLLEAIERRSPSFAAEIARFHRGNVAYDRCFRPVYDLMPAVKRIVTFGAGRT